MLSLNLPPYATKIAVRDGKNAIWDIIRRKYVALDRVPLTSLMLLLKSQKKVTLAEAQAVLLEVLLAEAQVALLEVQLEVLLAEAQLL